MKAKLNYIRIAPRKLRLVADVVRGRKVAYALTILKFSKKGGSKPIAKLLASAVANAKNSGSSEEDLRVGEIKVDQGPVYKRYMPRAFGSASLIRKKTSKVTLVLKELPQKSKPPGA